MAIYLQPLRQSVDTMRLNPYRHESNTALTRVLPTNRNADLPIGVNVGRGAQGPIRKPALHPRFSSTMRVDYRGGLSINHGRATLLSPSFGFEATNVSPFMKNPAFPGYQVGQVE